MASQDTTRTGAAVMRWSRWAYRAGAALFVLSIPIALIGSNVRYLFGERRLYEFAITRYDASTATGIPAQELHRAMRDLRDYLAGPDEFLRIDVTDAEGFSGPLFNPKEAAHMRDVRTLIQGIFRAQEAALVVALGFPVLCVALAGRVGARRVLRLTWLTGLGVNVAAVGFGVAAFLGFDRLFDQFHALSFAAGSWQFDPARDRLVQLFPFEFWQISAGLLVGMTLVEAALLAIGGRWAVSRIPPSAASGDPVAVPPDGDAPAEEQGLDRGGQQPVVRTEA